MAASAVPAPAGGGAALGDFDDYHFSFKVRRWLRAQLSAAAPRCTAPPVAHAGQRRSSHAVCHCRRASAPGQVVIVGDSSSGKAQLLDSACA